MARMTDQQVRAKAGQFRQLKAQAAELEVQAAKLQTELLAEIKRRGGEAIVLGSGTKVAPVASTRTTYDTDKAKAALPAPLFRSLTTRVITRAAVQLHLEAGKLAEDQIKQFAVRHTSEPYVRVSGPA